MNDGSEHGGLLVLRLCFASRDRNRRQLVKRSGRT